MTKMQRIALVTGGTNGIGAAIAGALQNGGYRVAVNFNSDEANARAFEARTGITCFQWDVADGAACEAGVNQISATLGPIDILVNNAGITRDAMLHKMTPAQWTEVLHTNLDSCFHMCRAVIESMRERNFGRIINISSVNGLTGQIGQTNYAAAKAGMIGFTKSLALEGAAHGITANVVAPGYTDTRMVQAIPSDVLAKILRSVPAGRLATPQEVARAVLFLAAEDAAFITGITLSVNGGKLMN
jgi:acetoacetyl-CoA reductase